MKDYAKSTSNSKKSHSAKKSSSTFGNSPFLIFIIGAITGGILTSYAIQKPQMIKQIPAHFSEQIQKIWKKHSHASAKASCEVKKVVENKSPEFDFYTMLPGGNNTSKTCTISEKSTTLAEQKATAKASYLLQVAAFKTLREADALKAQLSLLGFQTKIQMVNAGKQKFYRVNLGPFADMKRVKNLQSELSKNHYSSIVTVQNG